MPKAEVNQIKKAEEIHNMLDVRSVEKATSTDPYTDLHVKLLQVKGIVGLLTIITPEDLANAPSDSLNQTAWAINDQLDDALNLLDNLHHRSLQA